MAKIDPWDQFQRADGMEPGKGFPAEQQPAQVADEWGQFQAAEQADQSTDLRAYQGVGALPDEGTAVLDETGESEFARPEDRAFAAKAQELLATGQATRAQFDALSQQYGYPLYGGDLDQAIAAGGLGWRIGVPLGGKREASPLAPLANSSAGALVGAAADTGAMGLSDEMVGLAQGDTLAEVAMGEGEAQRRAQLLKETAREEYPVESFAGSMVGGVTGSAGLGRLVPGRQLAADTAYGVGYGAGESNDNRAGGAALGGITAAGGSYFGGKLLDKVANRGPSQAAQNMGKAREYGIDLPMGAAGRGTAILEKGLDILPSSAGVMQRGRDALSEQVTDAVGNVAGEFGPSTSFAGMGEALRTGADKWVDKFQRVAGKVYDAIRIAPDQPASLTNTAVTLRDLNGKFASNPKLAEAMRNSRLSSYMDALGQANSKLSWNDLKAFRSRIGEEIGDQRFSDGTMKSELRGLYGALSEDMKATAAAAGPAQLRQFERANTLYKQGQDRIDGALAKILGDDGKMTPEKAAAKMQAIAKEGRSSSDLGLIAQIRKSMPSEEWGQVQNALVQLAGQPLNKAGREFDPGVFVRTFKDMGDPAKNLIFGKGELRTNLDEFGGVMDQLAKVNALRNTSNTAPGMIGSGAIMAALTSPIAVGIPMAGGAVATNILAKVWTNPRFVKWATGYARMARGAAQSGGQPNVSKQLELLKKVAAAEPAIAQDVLGLQQYLAQQFAQSPGKLAASENTQDGGQEPPQ